MPTLIDFVNFTTAGLGGVLNQKVEIGKVARLVGGEGFTARALFNAFAGYGNYFGEVFVNGYPLRHNFLQMRENIEFIGERNSFHLNILPKKQLAMLSRRWCGVDLSDAAVKAMGLEDCCEGFLFGQLIDDQQRRFELARLVACPAKVWLLDRPEARLSPNSIDLLVSLVEHRVSKGGLVFCNTNEPRLIDLVKLELLPVA